MALEANFFQNIGISIDRPVGSPLSESGIIQSRSRGTHVMPAGRAKRRPSAEFGTMCHCRLARGGMADALETYDEPRDATISSSVFRTARALACSAR